MKLIMCYIILLLILHDNITCTKHKNNDKYFEIRKAQHNIN